MDNNGEVNQTESEVDSFLNSRITVEEISHFIKSLKSNKACGIDMILNEYLKSTLNIMLSKYVVLFNEILTSGHVPNIWAIGKIMPIFKNKGSNTDPSNYMGITLLSCLGKAFRTIVNNRLTSVVDIHYNQAGFYLTVNENKTKIMIFSDRKFKHRSTFYYAKKKWKLSRTLSISVLFLVSMGKCRIYERYNYSCAESDVFYFKKIKSFKLVNRHTINFIL